MCQAWTRIWLRWRQQWWMVSRSTIWFYLDHTSNVWLKGRQWIAKHFSLGRTPAMQLFTQVQVCIEMNESEPRQNRASLSHHHLLQHRSARPWPESLTNLADVPIQTRPYLACVRRSWCGHTCKLPPAFPTLFPQLQALHLQHGHGLCFCQNHFPLTVSRRFS